MKLFNIGMVLNWARKENDRRGCDSVFIKAAEDEYTALLKINKESAKLGASMEKKAPPNKPSEEICSLCKYEGQVGFCEQCGINYVSTCQFESKLSHIG